MWNRELQVKKAKNTPGDISENGGDFHIFDPSLSKKNSIRALKPVLSVDPAEFGKMKVWATFQADFFAFLRMDLVLRASTIRIMRECVCLSTCDSIDVTRCVFTFDEATARVLVGNVKATSKYHAGAGIHYPVKRHCMQATQTHGRSCLHCCARIISKRERRMGGERAV